MDTQKTPITCPSCATTATMHVPLKVNTRMDRGARQGILSGGLFAFVCQECGYTAEVLPRGFLYQDPDALRMVYLSPAGGEPMAGAPLPNSFSRYRLRVVADRVQLVEQILITEAGLDDRHVMLFKAVMKPAIDRQQAHPPAWMVFAGLLGEGREVALSLPDGSVVALPLEKLDEVCEQYPLDDEPPLEWLRVDAAWAATWIHDHPTVRRGTWWNR